MTVSTAICPRKLLGDTPRSRPSR